MELAHLALSQLSVSAANMRASKKSPDVTDLIPSVRTRGVLTPLLVRPCAGDGRFEIVAGRRRYHAVMTIADEGGNAPLLPCAIMHEGDDAAALEASIIENHARQDPDEVTQWAGFTRLVKEGRTVGQIAATFGLEDAYVRRVLALGNLLPRIRDLYAKDEIDALTIRFLTLATRAKQAEWLALYRDADAHAPTGQQLKNWLMGGQSIPTKAALFDLATYPDPIITDLFGEDCYFGNAESFWTLQGEAIAVLRQGYIDAGWSDVVVMETGHYFQRWEHEKVGKEAGGKVFITVTRQGEVEAHEGWLTAREARKRERAEQPVHSQVASRPELTSNLQSYLDLHRHAMVQAALVQRPGVALRLMVAHAISGSWLWNVRPDPLRAPTPAITESHEHCAARSGFAAARSGAGALLGLEQEGGTITGGTGMDMSQLFQRLLALSDEEVMSILCVAMAETLAVGSGVIDAVGVELAIDPLSHWQPDETFLTLLRQRVVLQALVSEVAGEVIAASNAHERVKTLRGILGDCLAGTNGRQKVEAWAPRWLRFPTMTYFAREHEAQSGAYSDIADDQDSASDAVTDTGAIENDEFDGNELAHLG